MQIFLRILFSLVLALVGTVAVAESPKRYSFERLGRDYVPHCYFTDEDLPAVRETHCLKTKVYFEKQCRANDVLACKTLADLYHSKSNPFHDAAVAEQLYIFNCLAGAFGACSKIDHQGYGQDQRDKAFATYKQRCDDQLNDACLNFAYALNSGLFGSRDSQASFELIQKLCIEGSQEACISQAATHSRQGEPELAIEILREHCDIADSKVCRENLSRLLLRQVQNNKDKIYQGIFQQAWAFGVPVLRQVRNGEFELVAEFFNENSSKVEKSIAISAFSHQIARDMLLDGKLDELVAKYARQSWPYLLRAAYRLGVESRVDGLDRISSVHRFNRVAKELTDTQLYVDIDLRKAAELSQDAIYSNILSFYAYRLRGNRVAAEKIYASIVKSNDPWANELKTRFDRSATRKAKKTKKKKSSLFGGYAKRRKNKSGLNWLSNSSKLQAESKPISLLLNRGQWLSACTRVDELVPRYPYDFTLALRKVQCDTHLEEFAVIPATYLPKAEPDTKQGTVENARLQFASINPKTPTNKSLPNIRRCKTKGSRSFRFDDNESPKSAGLAFHNRHMNRAVKLPSLCPGLSTVGSYYSNYFTWHFRAFLDQVNLGLKAEEIAKKFNAEILHFEYGVSPTFDRIGFELVIKPPLPKKTTMHVIWQQDTSDYNTFGSGAMQSIYDYFQREFSMGIESTIEAVSTTGFKKAPKVKSISSPIYSIDYRDQLIEQASRNDLNIKIEGFDVHSYAVEYRHVDVLIQGLGFYQNNADLIELEKQRTISTLPEHRQLGNLVQARLDERPLTPAQIRMRRSNEKFAREQQFRNQQILFQRLKNK